MKCAKCDKQLFSMNIEEIKGTVPLGRSYHCIAYTCPHCSCAISVQMDPIALRKDILDGVQTQAGALAKKLNDLLRRLP